MYKDESINSIASPTQYYYKRIRTHKHDILFINRHQTRNPNDDNNGLTPWLHFTDVGRVVTRLLTIYVGLKNELMTQRRALTNIKLGQRFALKDT